MAQSPKRTAAANVAGWTPTHSVKPATCSIPRPRRLRDDTLVAGGSRDPGDAYGFDWGA
jgi:hypothetical protein